MTSLSGYHVYVATSNHSYAVITDAIALAASEVMIVSFFLFGQDASKVA